MGFIIALSIYAQVDETHVRLTNLPHIYINTFSGNSITSKTNYVLARMWYVDEKDSVAFYDSLEIRGRGNSTWGLAKKPYKIKFHQKEKFLGKGYAKAKKWTLMANHGDKSLIRNALTSRLGEWLGLDFNPAAKFVDLTLNDQFVGNYQISDQVEVRPHRVHITEQDTLITEESNITGGYLLECDGFKDFQNGKTGFYTPTKALPIRIHYPDEDDLVNEQYKYIRDFTTTFEQRLYSDDFKNAEEGYRPMVDSASLVNWYIASEVSGNIDAFFSTYFYKDQDDDKFYWGPLWDYDIAYANDNRKGDTSRQLMRDVGYGTMREWVQRMWQDPWFTTLVARRFNEAVENNLSDFMWDQIDSLTYLLDSSQRLNYERWGINQRTLRERVLHSTYNEYIDDLRDYVTEHISYLDEVFSSYMPEEPVEPEPKVPDFVSDTLVYYSISNAGTGTCFDLNANENICGNHYDEESESQQWRIFPLANGYLFIVNRMTGKALNDPTEGEPTATTLTGTQLNTAKADSTDWRQQWDLVKQGDSHYNFVNHFSQHAANLSGGNSADGTSILSYTSDGRDATSKNRLWTIEGVDEYPDAIIDTPQTADTDYALAYNPTDDLLHFGAEDRSALTFTVRLYDAAGRLVRNFRAQEECSLRGLPQGLYTVSWTVRRRQRSVKFIK